MGLPWPPAPLSETWLLSLTRTSFLTHMLNRFQGRPSFNSVTLSKTGIYCLIKAQKNQFAHLQTSFANVPHSQASREIEFLRLVFGLPQSFVLDGHALPITRNTSQGRCPERILTRWQNFNGLHSTQKNSSSTLRTKLLDQQSRPASESIDFTKPRVQRLNTLLDSWISSATFGYGYMDYNNSWTNRVHLLWVKRFHINLDSWTHRNTTILCKLLLLCCCSVYVANMPHLLLPGRRILLCGSS